MHPEVFDEELPAAPAKNAGAAKTIGARSRRERGGTARDRVGHRVAARLRRHYNLGGLS